MDKLAGAIESLADSLQAAEKEYIARTDLARLSAAQLAYLDFIHHRDNPSLGECARAFGVSKPSVTAVVERLVALGLLEKIRSDEDRRSSHLHLTKEGRRLAAVHEKFHREYTERLFGALKETEIRKIGAVLLRALAGE